MTFRVINSKMRRGKVQTITSGKEKIKMKFTKQYCEWIHSEQEEIREIENKLLMKTEEELEYYRICAKAAKTDGYFHIVSQFLWALISTVLAWLVCLVTVKNESVAMDYIVWIFFIVILFEICLCVYASYKQMQEIKTRKWTEKVLAILESKSFKGKYKQKETRK